MDNSKGSKFPKVFFESLPQDPVALAVKFSKKFSLFDRGDKVLVAVSGGKDSTFLLYMLSNFRSKFGIKEVVCGHFNHLTRGEESFRDENFVAELCKSMGIKYKIGRAQRVLKTESEMRKERYNFLDLTAREFGATKIATAHTLDDQIETFIINLIRGGGFFSASGISIKNTDICSVAVVRPILVIRRSKILSFLRERQIPFIEDSSNYDLSYLRNQIRAFLNLLPDEIYSNLLSGFMKFWLSSIEIVDFLAQVIKEEKAISEKISPFIKKQIELFEEKNGKINFEELKRAF